jgi:undecaprenyl-diphosphatase
LFSEKSSLGWYLIISTIPAGLAGIFLKGVVERAFDSILMTGIALIVTAFLLLLAEYIGHRKTHTNKIGWLDAFWIGVFQIFAIFPGISRSGSTITGGMLRDFDRPMAARYSFLMSIPIMLAAGALEVYELATIPNFLQLLPPFLLGFIAAAIVGYLSIKWLIIFLTKKPLYLFAIYCGILGSIITIVSMITA